MKGKRLTVQLDQKHYEKLERRCSEEGVKKSELIRGLVDAGDYISRKEVIKNTVILMDNIQKLEGECPEELYSQLRKSGEDLCRSLLIN